MPYCQLCREVSRNGRVIEERLATIFMDAHERFCIGRRVIAKDEYQLCNWATRNGAYLVFA